MYAQAVWVGEIVLINLSVLKDITISFFLYCFLLYKHREKKTRRKREREKMSGYVQKK